uniref:Uncharacterized protein n=1 Tax=Glossina austeni TaxID=7395 RepID=A0A1A9UKV0_GLOAU
MVVPNVPILGNGGETAAETRELVEFIREAAFNTVGDSVLTSVVVVAEVLVKAVAFAVVGDFVFLSLLVCTGYLLRSMQLVYYVCNVVLKLKYEYHSCYHFDGET